VALESGETIEPNPEPAIVSQASEPQPEPSPEIDAESEAKMEAEPIPEPVAEIDAESEIHSAAADSQSLHADNSVVAEHRPEELEPGLEGDLPAIWRTVGGDRAVQFLRIVDLEGQKEIRRLEVAVGVLEEQSFGVTGQILESLSFGAMKHAAFEGEQKIIHSWQRADLRVTAVIDAGASASLLAARAARAFEDHK